MATEPPSIIVERRGIDDGPMLGVGETRMKARNEAGIRLALENVKRAQMSRLAPPCKPPTPSTQLATRIVNTPNHLLIGLSGRARQTNNASAARSAVRVKKGT